MLRLKTLDNVAELERSRFGRPKPRHGLKLLYWFTNNCVTFDGYSDMILECDPESREFGFHFFNNRYDTNGAKLLPDVDLPYYLVGNLNSPGAHQLPDYVREDYTGYLDGSNMDRIIVSLDNEWIDRVYVTQHDDRTNFNPDATYRISEGLLKFIRNLELNDFLRQTGYIQCVPRSIRITPGNRDDQIERHSTEDNDSSSDEPVITRRNGCCGCTIL